MAAEVRAAGHFDKVIIDQVIHLLHKEEAAGVEHRDRGQNRKKKSNDLEDLGHSINKSGKATTRLGKEQSQLQDEISSLNLKLCPLRRTCRIACQCETQSPASLENSKRRSSFSCQKLRFCSINAEAREAISWEHPNCNCQPENRRNNDHDQFSYEHESWH